MEVSTRTKILQGTLVLAVIALVTWGLLAFMPGRASADYIYPEFEIGSAAYDAWQAGARAEIRFQNWDALVAHLYQRPAVPKPEVTLPTFDTCVPIIGPWSDGCLTFY